MELTALRTWQWMVIGTLAGAVVGFAWSSQSTEIARTGDKTMFQRLVRQSAGAIARKQPPPIRDIVVHEPELDPANVLVYPVTYEYQPPPTRAGFWQQIADKANNGGKAPAKAPEPQWQTGGIYAATPFVGNQSILDFLAASKVSFANRTGNAKYIPMYYSAAAGFVIVGLLWPAAIQLLIRAGLAKPPAPRPKKQKAKPRIEEPEDDMLVKPTARPIDAGALNALNDAMEAKLGASLPPGTARAAPTATAEPVSVFLSGTASRNTSDPTEAVPVPETPEEKKDYGGEYYPVARSTKKDDHSH